MAYDNQHTENHCDKCLKDVGKENLIRVPFLYKDCNDKVHEDMGDAYRQYYICEECNKKGY